MTYPRSDYSKFIAGEKAAVHLSPDSATKKSGNGDFLNVCKKCRKCCTGTDIRLIPDDLERWEKEGRLDILLAINPLIGGSRQLIKKQENDECIFLSEDGACRIYETRPYICKRFPTDRKHAEVFECRLVDHLY